MRIDRRSISMRVRAMTGTVFACGIVAAYSITTTLHAQTAPPPHYSVIDLGTVGGDNSYATALNNSGQVTGWLELIPGNVWSNHAFVYSNGVIHDVGASFGKNSSRGFGINS